MLGVIGSIFKTANQLNTAMAKSEENPEKVDTPKRSAGASGKERIFITNSVKYNGTFYSGTVAEVDSATAKKLIADGAAREATSEEISADDARIEDQRRPITEKEESLRALGIEPAVDSNGNVIPGSFVSRETKLRNAEGNTLAGAGVNEADAAEGRPTPNASPNPRDAKSAEAPDSTPRKRI